MKPDPRRSACPQTDRKLFQPVLRLTGVHRLFAMRPAEDSRTYVIERIDYRVDEKDGYACLLTCQPAFHSA